MPPLILGGGPAGAAAAIRLAQAGHPVRLIERSSLPHDKVCGDFLSAGAIGAVTALGVDLAAFAPAPIRRVRLIHGAAEASATLPFAAVGLSRRVLDEALLARAAAAGAVLLRGHAVRSVRRTRVGFTVDAGGHGMLTASEVFLATGKHDLRGAARPRHGDALVGLKTYLELAADQREALAGTVELVLFPGGYAGLQPVEAGRAVLCLLLPRRVLRRLQAWPAVLAWLAAVGPHLARRLAGAVVLLPRPIAVAGIPYGYVHRQDGPDGLFRLGDQAGVIPSLSGDGVAIALHSGGLAAEAWLAGDRSTAYHQRLRGDIARPIRLAGLAHRLCRSRVLQSWAVAACRQFPALPGWVAAATRVG